MATLRAAMGTDADGNLAKDMYAVMHAAVKDKLEEFWGKIEDVKNQLFAGGVPLPSHDPIEVPPVPAHIFQLSAPTHNFSQIMSN